AIHALNVWGVLCDLLRAKARSLDTGAAATTSAAITLSRCGYAITKIGAGDRSFNAFRATRPVALSLSHGHVEPTCHGCDQLAVRFAVGARFQPIRIAEPARLHFLDRSIHGRHHRTSLEVPGMNQHRTGSAGLL